MPAWLERAAPASLGVFLAKTASPRKSGLFVRHLCRCFPDVFSDPTCFAVLDAADQYESGEIGEGDLQAAVAAAGEVAHTSPAGDDRWERRCAEIAARFARDVAAQGFYPDVLSHLRHIVLDRAGAGSGPRKNPIARAMRPVFLEHFGDTQRPVTRDPSWLTGTVLALAQGIYAERAFDRLPILADALIDAGCDNADVLGHCRGPGPHARGCWVVDLLLGKT